MTQKITFRFFERQVIFLRKTPFKKISALAARLVHQAHLGHLFWVACGFP